MKRKPAAANDREREGRGVMSSRVFWLACLACLLLWAVVVAVILL